MTHLDTPVDRRSAQQIDASHALVRLLSMLYSHDDARSTAARLLAVVERCVVKRTTLERTTQNGALLITYGDTLHADDVSPIAALESFLNDYVGDAFRHVHLLPFFPASSDDGFAVIDYRRVDHHVGSWPEVSSLSERYQLMFDLVINHCSREHLWFADFVSGREPGKDYFITLPENSDVSLVTRPRSSPLISDVHTYSGIRHVWTTFSADQIDLDFGNPDVLVEMVEVLFFYIERGARLIRLDAVAFLWKRLGSSCMSLPETHIAVKVLRLLVDLLPEEVLLITETNVPHAENVSYYGDGDEAHGVYQFSLAPLMLNSYTFGNAQALTDWAMQLDAPPDGCFALNFMASHDGIGLRPLEGLISDDAVDKLVEKMHERGGFASMRDTGQGVQRPYEINISLFSAFGGTVDALPAYLGAHALLMAFAGMPGIYIHSLLGSENDLGKMEETGRTRSINRGTLSLDRLALDLANDASIRAQSLRFIVHALRVRARQPAFAFDASQSVLDIAPSLVVLERRSKGQTLLVLASVVPQRLTIAAADLGVPPATYRDVLGSEDVPIDPLCSLRGFQVLWLDITNVDRAKVS